MPTVDCDSLGTTSPPARCLAGRSMRRGMAKLPLPSLEGAHTALLLISGRDRGPLDRLELVLCMVHNLGLHHFLTWKQNMR